ncbi:MAG TPA: hypothetical protein VJN92_12555 [Candidatus Acidoferrum sp.]|nr:hypothetical protein [Candidatus Acidoferrum sp.]
MSSAANPKTNPSKSAKWRLSLDSWAVVLALLAALLVRAGILKHIPW